MDGRQTGERTALSSQKTQVCPGYTPSFEGTFCSGGAERASGVGGDPPMPRRLFCFTTGVMAPGLQAGHAGPVGCPVSGTRESR